MPYVLTAKIKIKTACEITGSWFKCYHPIQVNRLIVLIVMACHSVNIVS